MTGKTIRQLLDDAVIFLNKADVGTIMLAPDRTMFVSYVHHEPCIKPAFYIGIQELCQDPNKEFSNVEAMIPIVALFHEVCGHGGQIKYEFDKNCNLSQVLGFNYYACKGSGAYYDGNALYGKFTKQYANQPHEIAAQYMAVKSARAYLSRVWGVEKADDMLLEYTNYRIKHKSEFVRSLRPYTSVNALLKDFDEAFQISVHTHRPYDFDDGCKSYDCFSAYAKHRCIAEADVRAVVKCDDGVQQDLVMAAAFYSDCSENRQLFRGKAFDGVDLRIEDAISTFQEFELLDERGYVSSLDTLTNMAKEISVAEDVENDANGENNEDDDHDYP